MVGFNIKNKNSNVLYNTFMLTGGLPETTTEKNIRLLKHNKLRYINFNPAYTDCKNIVVFLKKYKGKSVKKIYKIDKSYLYWIINNPYMLARHYKLSKCIFIFLKYKETKNETKNIN